MLVLVRHGESVDQVENRMSGQSNCALSPRGVEQAEELAVELSAYEFDAVHSSDLIRCVDTTAAILRRNANTDPSVLVYAEELRERSGGLLEGREYKDIRQELPPKKYKLWRRDYFEAPPMGESLKDVEERVIPYLKNHVFPLVNEGKNVILVTSAGVIRTIICYIKSSDETEIVKLEIENAMPYILYGEVRKE